MTTRQDNTKETTPDVKQAGTPSSIKGWQRAGVLLELHAGATTFLPPHSHPRYQIGITTRDPGEYLCRGHVWTAPRGSIIMFPPDEVHSVVRAGGRRNGDVSRLMFVDPATMLAAAREVFGPAASLPRFDELVIQDAIFIEAFHDVHVACACDEAVLEHEAQARLHRMLCLLVRGFAAPQPTAALPREHQWLKAARARDFIVSNYRDNITLTELADVAHSSPFHLNRLFARHVGMPPHAFQNQVRVERSKALLLEGTPIAEIATLTGFFDQSHFTRYFRRIVGVTPSRYLLPSQS